MMNVAVRSDDRFVAADGLNIRYLENGSGVPAILLHGASLGSSADVFRRNLRSIGRWWRPRHRLRSARLRQERPGPGPERALQKGHHPQIHGRAEARQGRA